MIVEATLVCIKKKKKNYFFEIFTFLSFTIILFFVGDNCQAPFQVDDGDASIIGGAWFCPGVNSKVILKELLASNFIVIYFSLFRSVFQLEESK